MSENIRGGEQSHAPLNLYALYEQSCGGETVALDEAAKAAVTDEAVYSRMVRRYGRSGAAKRFEENETKVTEYRDFLTNELLLRTFDDELSYTDDSEFLIWGMEQIVERGTEGLILQRDPASMRDETDRLTTENMLARSLGYAHMFIERKPGQKPEILQAWLKMFRARAAASKSPTAYLNGKLEKALMSDDHPNIHLQLPVGVCANQELAFIRDTLEYEKTLKPSAATIVSPRQVIQRLAIFSPEDVGLDHMHELRADLLYDSLKVGGNQELADYSSAALTNYLVGITLRSPARIKDHLVGKAARLLYDRKQRDMLHFPVINVVAHTVTPALSKIVPDELASIETSDIADYPKAVDRLVYLGRMVAGQVLDDEVASMYAAAGELVQLLAVQAAQEKLEERRSMIGLGDLTMRYGATDPSLLEELKERHASSQSEIQLHAFYRSRAGKHVVDQLFEDDSNQAVA